MANRLSKEKAGLIASNYCTNGYKKVKALLDAGYATSYANNVGLKLFDNSRVKEAISRIQARTAADTSFTVQAYQQQLDEDRAMAIELKQPSACVSATVAKGRSCGYDKSNEIGNVDKPQDLTGIEAEAIEASKKIQAIRLAGSPQPTAGPSADKRKELA